MKNIKKKNKKKICFVATHTYPLFNPNEKSAHGGSEVQLYTISKEIAKNENNEVSFLVGDFRQKKYEYYNSIKVIRTFNPQNTNSSIIQKGFQALRYLYILTKENPHICITSSANSTVGVVGLYCIIFRKKHIHRTANIIDVNNYWIKKNGFLGKVYKFGLEHANEVVCQTIEQKDALLKNYHIKATLFRNVFNFENRKIPPKKDYILWVGRANRTKGAEHYLELVKKNPKLKFVMIFNKQDDTYYDEISLEAKMQNNLTFIEKVPFEKIQKYYDEAKLFVSTSKFEGFANTFIQSGIGKTPVISLNSNPDNFINKYNCGFFANGSKIMLNDYVNILMEDKEKYNKFSTNIYEYVKEKYDIQKNIKVIQKLL